MLLLAAADVVGGLVVGAIMKALLPSKLNPAYCTRLAKAIILGCVVTATAEPDFVRGLLPEQVEGIVAQLTRAGS